jgi:tryptophanyl-tRNA synthetase
MSVCSLADRAWIEEKYHKKNEPFDPFARMAHHGHDFDVASGKTDAEIEKEFGGLGYGHFKLAVGEIVADALAPVHAEFDRLMADKAYLEGVMKDGSAKAAYLARKTLSKVYRKVGFTQPK